MHYCDDTASHDILHACSVETSDDILAKYRRPNIASSPRKTNDDSDDVDSGKASSSRAAAAARHNGPITEQQQQQQPPAYDPSNLESCKAFLDAKKKLRLVLSTADFQVLYCVSHYFIDILYVSAHVFQQINLRLVNFVTFTVR